MVAPYVFNSRCRIWPLSVPGVLNLSGRNVLKFADCSLAGNDRC